MNANETENEAILIKKYGITLSSKTTYCYRQYRYTNLQDALKYAELEAAQSSSESPDSPLQPETSGKVSETD